MRSTLAALVTTVTVSGAVASGCSHPNRLDIPRANLARDVEWSKTPTDTEHEIEGKVNGEVRRLAKWARRAAPGDTIECILGPGVYVIDDAIAVKGCSLVIAGSGIDKTRIKLASDEWRCLTVRNAANFELRGVTVAGYSGGGIDVHDCARVVVNDCDFVGSRYGLELESSTAYIDSCVFAGNEVGLELNGGRTLIRGSCFATNWWAMHGTGRVEGLGCAFFGNERGVEILAEPGTILRSILIAHDDNWSGGGKPKFESSLLGPDDLLERASRPGTAVESKPIGDITEFPEALPGGIPPNCDLGAIHYAIERFATRGLKNAPAKIDDVLKGEAEYFAAGARRALSVKQMAAAKELARLAHGYLLALPPKSAARADYEDIEKLAVAD